MRKLVKLLCVAALLLQGLFAGQAHAQTAFRVVVNMNQQMVQNQAYYSPNGRYYVVFQSDGNLVVYRAGSPVPQNAIWASGTNGITGGIAILQGDGNFVIYKNSMTPQQTAVWNSGSGSALADRVGAQPFVSIRDDGALDVAGWGAVVKWSSPADPASPGTCTVRQYPICVFPGTMNQFNSFVLACSVADAQRQALSSGAVYGTCY